MAAHRVEVFSEVFILIKQFGRLTTLYFNKCLWFEDIVFMVVEGSDSK